VAALVEPLSIAEKGLLQLFAVQSRLPWDVSARGREGPGHCHRALVLGAGPVGLLGAMALRVRGFETSVYSLEPDDHPKAALVRRARARFVLGGEPRPRPSARARPGDVVYEGGGRVAARARDPGDRWRRTASPSSPACRTARALRVRHDGLVRRLVLGNQVLLGTVNAGRDAFAAAIRDLATFDRRWPGPLRSSVTGRFPIEAYRELLLGPPSGIKNSSASEPERVARAADPPRSDDDRR
jgi:hypothetical protein